MFDIYLQTIFSGGAHLTAAGLAAGSGRRRGAVPKPGRVAYGALLGGADVLQRTHVTRPRLQPRRHAAAGARRRHAARRQRQLLPRVCCGCGRRPAGRAPTPAASGRHRGRLFAAAAAAAARPRLIHRQVAQGRPAGREDPRCKSAAALRSRRRARKGQAAGRQQAGPMTLMTLSDECPGGALPTTRNVLGECGLLSDTMPTQANSAPGRHLLYPQGRQVTLPDATPTCETEPSVHAHWDGVRNAHGCRCTYGF